MGPMILHPLFSFPLTRPGLFPIRCGHTGWGACQMRYRWGACYLCCGHFACLSYQSACCLSGFSFFGCFLLVFQCVLAAFCFFFWSLFDLFIRGSFLWLAVRADLHPAAWRRDDWDQKAAASAVCIMPAPMVTAMPMTKRAATFLETVFFTCIISMIGTSLCGDDCMTPLLCYEYRYLT